MIKFQSKFIKIALNFLFIFIQKYILSVSYCSIVKSNMKKYFSLHSKKTNINIS